MKYFIILAALLVSFCSFAENLPFDKNVVYTVGATNVPPLIFKSEEFPEPKGITIDYLKKLEDRGLKYHIRWFDSWSEVLAAAKAGEIDMIFAAVKTPERAEYLNFPPPYVMLENRIIHRADLDYIHTLTSLKGRKVAVLENSGVHEILRRNHPEIKLIPTKDELRALSLASFGEVDATVMELARVTYYIKKYGITNLELGDNADIRYDLTLATPKDRTGLYEFLSDVIPSVVESHGLDITDKWISLTENQPLIHREDFKLFAAGTLIILLSIATFAVLLKRQVAAKTKDLMRHAVVFNNTSEGIIITDEFNNIQACNQSVINITGYSEKELIGSNPRMLSSGKHGKRFYQHIFEAVNTKGVWIGEIWNKKKNGTIYPQRVSITCVRNSAGKITNYVSIFTDLSEQKNKEKEISFLAYHDHLTGALNRRGLIEKASELLETAPNDIHALLYIDLDRFKVINDTLGHNVGDELLKLVVGRIKTCVKHSDLVARYGGDEFIVVLKSVAELENVDLIASKITANISEPYKIGENVLHITTSVGVGIYDVDGNTVNELTTHADMAMYAAKSRGRNTFMYFNKEMDERAAERLFVENDLRMAIEAGELQLHFQPQVNLKTNRIIGAEALIRWKRPDGSFVPPKLFIPIAEESELILLVGEWVIKNAVEYAKDFINIYGVDFVVSINVSAKQFKHGKFVDVLNYALAANDISSKNIEVELTESVLVDNIDLTMQIFDSLRNCGISSSLDDFGTGYSSFAYLQSFPINRLKVDQSFVRDISERHNQAIVRAIIAMAKSMDLTVIAEGVETDEQLEMLRRFGCDEIQGYIIGKPCAFEEFIERFKE